MDIDFRPGQDLAVVVGNQNGIIEYAEGYELRGSARPAV
jgi:hypothetical protein